MSKRFRIALSFAGEQRAFVDKVAHVLAAKFSNERILYDKFHEAEFARRNLGVYLPSLYRDESDLIVPILCPAYDAKRWTGLEWNHIMELMTRADENRVLLCRFGHVEVSGLSAVDGFVELDGMTAETAVELILQRLALNEKKPRDYYTSLKNCLSDNDSPTMGSQHLDGSSQQTCDKTSPGILFVDDEPASRRAFNKLFEKDYRVHQAPSVDAGISFLQEHYRSVALIMTDQRMPRRRGVELLKFARQNYPRIRRILVSAYTDFDSLVDAVNSGCVHGFLYKPWEEHHLRYIVKSAVEAFINNEVSPSFVLPVEPVRPVLRVEETSTVPDTLNKTVKLEQRVEQQADQLAQQTLRVNELEAAVQQLTSVSRIAPTEAKRTASSIAFTSLVAASSISPNVRSIVTDLGSLLALVRLHQSERKDFPFFRPLFRLMRGEKDRRVEAETDECATELSNLLNHISQYREQFSLGEQAGVVTALFALSNIVASSQMKGHKLNGVFSNIFGSDDRIERLQSNLAVVTNYLANVTQ